MKLVFAYNRDSLFIFNSLVSRGHILRRPFSVYYTEKEGKVLAILYQVVGYGTSHMTTLPSVPLFR